jgi:hypothetical protein
LLLVLLIGLSSTAFGHQDTIIELERDGVLHGLPAAYEPASLLILEDPRKSHTVVLRIADRRVEFPECLSVLFAKADRHLIRLSASWYHDPTVLPYYLCIELPTRRTKFGSFDGWKILIDLNNASLIELSAAFESLGGNAQRYQKVDVNSFCNSDELARLVPQRVVEPPAVQPLR